MTNVCKVIDEIVLVVQVWMGKFGVQDILLDGGCSVNIILKNVRKKLGLRKLQPAVVRMVD